MAAKSWTEIIHLGETDEWTYTCVQQAGVNFASASSERGAGVIQVFVNDAEVEYVNLQVPHSWWPGTAQSFCPTLMEGDTLTIKSRNAPVDVRLDLFENG